MNDKYKELFDKLSINEVLYLTSLMKYLDDGTLAIEVAPNGGFIIKDLRKNNNE